MGLESVYGKQEIGSDGLTKKQRKFQEDSALCDKMIDEMILKQLDSVNFAEPSDDEALPATRPRLQSNRLAGLSSSARNIPTLRSREAAAALSESATRTNRLRTAASKSRTSPSSILTSKRKGRVPTNPSSMRSTAAAVNSKTTLGYSKGRSVSSTLRENGAAQSQTNFRATLSPETYIRLYGPPPLGSAMWTRCKAAGYFDIQKQNDEPEEPLEILGEDEEADSFQLTL